MREGEKDVYRGRERGREREQGEEADTIVER